MLFGKLPAELSDSDLMFSNLMRAVPVPPAYNWDDLHPGIPAPMFDNDRLGCCVMSGRAHQTLRFEFVEQNRILLISDKDVETEYFKETGGQDSGLVVSRSLKAWRQRGWKVAGQNYKIKAYSRIDQKRPNEVQQALYADLGVGIGFEVPQSAMDQFNAGQPWDVVPNDGGILGGHYVYCVGYDPTGVTCITWAQHQKMTWAFWEKYVDEVWANLDARNTSHRGLIDLNFLDDFLSTLK